MDDHVNLHQDRNQLPGERFQGLREHALKLRRNSVSGVCRVSVITAVYFLTYPYMLHRLGTERFGMWALALVISQSLGTQDLGVSGALMSSIPGHWSNGDTTRIQQLASTGVFLLAAVGVTLGIGVFLLRDHLVALLKIPPPLRNEMAWLLVGMAAVFFLNLVSSGLTAILIGIHRMDLGNIAYTSAAVVQAGGVFLVLSRGYGLPGLTISSIFTAFLWALTTLILLYRCLPGFCLRPSFCRRSDAISLLRYGSNIQAAGLGSFLTVPPIKLLLSRYVSLASVSSFELASGMALQVRSVFLMAAMPLIPASAHFSSEKAIHKLGLLYRRSFRYNVLTVLPFFSVVAILAPGFTEFWLHQGSSSVATTLDLLLVGWLFNTLSLPAYFMLQGRGFARYQVYVAALQATCAALFGYVLVHMYGYYGAVTGLVIGLFLAAIYLLWQYSRLHGDDQGRLFDGTLFKAVAINITLMVPFVAFPQLRETHYLLGLVLLSLGYLATYVLMLFLFGCLSARELHGMIFFRALTTVKSSGK